MPTNRPPRAIDVLGEDGLAAARRIATQAIAETVSTIENSSPNSPAYGDVVLVLERAWALTALHSGAWPLEFVQLNDRETRTLLTAARERWRAPRRLSGSSG